MTLPLWALTTFDAARDYVGLSTEDTSAGRAALEHTITAVSSACAKVAGFVDDSGDPTWHYRDEIVERLASRGGPKFILSTVPIDSIESVELIDRATGSVVSTLDTTSYRIDHARAGIVEIDAPGSAYLSNTASGFEDMTPAARLIEVEYTAGWVTPEQERVTAGGSGALTRTLPYEIETACLESVASNWRRRGQDKNIVSESISGQSSTSKTWRDARVFLTAETLSLLPKRPTV